MRRFLVFVCRSFIIETIEVMTWRKRSKEEWKPFNSKLENSLTWTEKFHYPFISEIIEVCLPKVNVSNKLFSNQIIKI